MSDLLLPTTQDIARKVLDSNTYMAYLVSLFVGGKEIPYKVDPTTISLDDNGHYVYPGDQGKIKRINPNLFVEFEIIGQTVEYEDETYPFLITKQMKYVGGELASLTKLVKALDPSGSKTQGGKINELLGSLCQVEIEKKPKVSDPSTYTNKITQIMGPPNTPGYVPPKMLTQTLKTFTFYTPIWDEYTALPRWIQNNCKSCLDFEGSILQQMIAENETTTEDSETEIAHEV